MQFFLILSIHGLLNIGMQNLWIWRATYVMAPACQCLRAMVIVVFWLCDLPRDVVLRYVWCCLSSDTDIALVPILLKPQRGLQTHCTHFSGVIKAFSDSYLGDIITIISALSLVSVRHPWGLPHKSQLSVLQELGRWTRGPAWSLSQDKPYLASVGMAGSKLTKSRCLLASARGLMACPTASKT